MQIHITIDDRLLEGIIKSHIEHYIAESLVIRMFIYNEIDIETVKDILRFSSIKEANDWIQIAKARKPLCVEDFLIKN